MNNPQESEDHSKNNDYRTIEQTMEKFSGGTRRLAAQLTTSASFDSLWSVLTDYDRLNLYIPNLLSSKKIFQKENNVHLKQVGAQDFLGMKFSAEVTIDLFEEKELGLLRFNLIKGNTNEEFTLYASHSLWSSKEDFINWTKSDAFRLAHKNAGQHQDLYLGSPNFEGFEVVL